MPIDLHRTRNPQPSSQPRTLAEEISAAVGELDRLADVVTDPQPSPERISEFRLAAAAHGRALQRFWAVRAKHARRRGRPRDQRDKLLDAAGNEQDLVEWTPIVLDTMRRLRSIDVASQDNPGTL